VNAKDQLVRVGNDKEPEVSKLAQKAGAVDKIVFTLPDSVAEADLVILAVPVDEVNFTLKTIAPHLKAGAVILGTSPIVVQSTQWAKELITAEDRYFLTFTPAVNAQYLNEIDKGPSSAHADLFKDNITMITTSPGIDASAVALAENLARLLGSTPVFADLHEVDGLLSSSSALPALLAASLVNITTSTPGWSDGRKVAGARFARIAELVENMDSGQKPALELIYNRENAVRTLDSLIFELQELRDVLNAGGEDQLNARFENARQAYLLWMRQRSTGKWEDKGKSAVQLPSFGSSIGRLFGIRPKSGKDDGKK
jgi:prephenate dehydrogenase